MSDLIDRQAAIDAVNDIASGLHARKRLDEEYIASWCAETIERLPSVQLEVIRCKDCKHYVIHTFFGRSQGWCERLCDEFDKSLARGTESDDYCSRAERREDG